MLGVEVPIASIPMIELPGLGRIRVVVVGPARLGRRFYEAAGFYSPVHDALIERVVRRRDLSAADSPSLRSSGAPPSTAGRCGPRVSPDAALIGP